MVLAASSLTDEQKGRMFATLARTDMCLSDGADEPLQLLSLAASMNRIATGVVVDCDREAP